MPGIPGDCRVDGVLQQGRVDRAAGAHVEVDIDPERFSGVQQDCRVAEPSIAGIAAEQTEALESGQTLGGQQALDLIVLEQLHVHEEPDEEIEPIAEIVCDGPAFANRAEVVDGVDPHPSAHPGHGEVGLREELPQVGEQLRTPLQERLQLVVASWTAIMMTSGFADSLCYVSALCVSSSQSSGPRAFC